MDQDKARERPQPLTGGLADTFADHTQRYRTSEIRRPRTSKSSRSSLAYVSVASPKSSKPHIPQRNGRRRKTHNQEQCTEPRRESVACHHGVATPDRSSAGLHCCRAHFAVSRLCEYWILDVARLLFRVLYADSTSIGGCVPALFLTDWFIAEQFSDPAAAAAAVPAANANANARLVAQQLGNAYGLLFMVGVAILYTTTELRVVRNYLVALLLADVGHVGLTMAAIGPEQFAAVRAWNAMTWGNVGFTACLSFCPLRSLCALRRLCCHASWLLACPL